MSYLLTHLLRSSAERYPERTAVWARGRTLTYRQLDEESNRLALLLRERGIRRGDRVGIYFPKSVDSLVCMLGAMKCGSIYVPLDPQAPAERIQYIIGDCGMRALMSVREKLKSLDSRAIGSVEFTVLADSKTEDTGHKNPLAWNELAGFDGSRPPETPSISTDLAYILYTSGSTGRPKGVMLSHLNALTFVSWCATQFQVRSEDRLSNHAPHHFDLSVFDIYNTLEAGATLYMIPDEVQLFPASLAPFIDKQALTIWYSVPSALVMLLQRGNLQPASMQSLRVLLFAGEVFPIKFLRLLVNQLPKTELYNLYGPTETNVCTYYRVERERLGLMDRLPIGIACGNTDVFAVTEGNRIAGIGEEGELYVRGTTVTSGYWGDAEKTRRGVVHNSFEEHFEEKCYRTGDLVKQAGDGNYDFIGRRDSMIKSRGYRIELGEIETALMSHPGVMEAAALAIPDEEIGNRIHAAVALHDSMILTVLDLQQYCAMKIPKYMIPEFIEFRKSLPKTSTGKLDRVTLAKEVLGAQAPVRPPGGVGRHS
jgi:amino acid adenylation domain-containing protein